MSTIAQALALGREHHQAGRLAQAEQLYRQVLGQDPRHAEALQLLATLAAQAGRRDQTVALLEQAVAAEPDNASCLANLGSAYVTAGRFLDARAPLERAIRLDPSSVSAYYHLGLLMDRTDQIDEAITNYRRSIELQPVNRPAHNNLGKLLRAQGKLDEASSHFDAALAADPNAPHVHYNRAMLWLSQGRFAEGWEEYEWRIKCREFGIRQLPQPSWDGTPLDDKTLLVRAEQGLGDTIQFVRYVPMVRARCRRVLIEVPATLLPLFRQSGIEAIVEQTRSPAAGPRPAPLPFDCHVQMPSLPRVFGTTLETIPADVPYLKASDALVAAWREKLATHAGCKVGIAWQGSPKHWDDRLRSMPLACFAPLAAIGGVHLLSVQKDHGREQLHTLGERFAVVDLQRDIDEAAEPFMDLAAIMMNLDLIITCDTSIAHLAGALGVPVWVALGARADWRWMLDRADSPWYPTMRLFRQPTLGDWQTVFRTMAEELRALIGRLAR